MAEFASRVENHFRFSKKEMTQIFITVVFAAFGLTLAKGWGMFDIVKGSGVEDYLFNLIIVFFMLFATFMVHFSAQKLMALKFGFISEYKYWLNGVLISTMVCFMSFGILPLFFTGSLWHDDVPKLRMGVFRGGARQKDIARISLAGPLSNLLLVGIIAPIYMATESSLVYTFIVINLLMAVYSMLPIPTFEKIRQFEGGTTGLYMFIFSRKLFVLMFSFVVFFSVLMLVFHVFSYIIAIALGIIVLYFYMRKYETDKK